MNKSSLKTFAINSRNELRDKTRIKLEILGITEKKIEEPTILGSMVSINGYEYNKGQYDSLVRRCNEIGYDELVEEVAYTWFNRLVAIGYMEYNEYIDEKIISSSTSKVDPDIIDNYFEANFFEEMDDDLKNKIHDLKDNHKTEEMYALLVEGKCNELSKIMDFMFEKKADYTELLFPGGLLVEGSFLVKLREILEESKEKVNDEMLIPVELIGWLYQFYNSEKKDEVFEGLKNNKKITKENIPAATQLFTPKWIVKYMVENSLGKLALESLGASEELKKEWKYYITPSSESLEMTPPSDGSPSDPIRPGGHLPLDKGKEEKMAIEDIKILDPAMGSGHMLTYSFDVLYDIYEDLGWTSKDAVLSILKNNIYGLEIDDRAGMLASFAIMMKAREKFRRLFRTLERLEEDEKITLNTLAIQESNGIGEQTIVLINEKGFKNLGNLVSTFKDAKEYGSILKIESIDNEQLSMEKEKLRDAYRNQGQINLFSNPNKLIDIEGPQQTLKISGGVWNFDEDIEIIESLIQQASVMASKYDVTITNPPYMGGKGYTPTLKKYVEKNYKDSKSDLFAVFIEKCGEYTKKDRYTAMITMHSWMFLSSFEKLRIKLIETKEIDTMVHLGTRAFEEIGGEVVQTTAWITKNRTAIKDGTFIRLVDYNNSEWKQREFYNKENYYQTVQKDFEKIPGSPIAYWVSDRVKEIFATSEILENYGKTRRGLQTGNSEVYIREWQEVNYEKLGKKWVKFNNGGNYRKWFGSLSNIVNWEKNGLEIKNSGKAIIPSEHLYFKEIVSWNKISSGNFAMKYQPAALIPGDASPFLFVENNLEYFLGLLNSKISSGFLYVLSPTLNFQVGDLSKIPVIISNVEKIKKNVIKNRNLAKQEWDSRETSWDFTVNPLINNEELTMNNEGLNSSLIIDNCSLEKSVEQYETTWRENFFQLHSNEEELNSLFIDIYGLQDEMDEKVSLQDITLLKRESNLEEITPSSDVSPYEGATGIELTEAEKEQGKVLVFDRSELVKQFISYAVGCIMGRYSIDKEGLIIANSDDDMAASHRKLHIIGEDGEERHTIENPRFIPDAFGVIPVTGEDIFDNDIVTKIVEFVGVVYGKDSLEENLNFIGTHLGMKNTESARETIRRYFLKDFYKDHCQRYKKRPIYWMVNSGKKDGFSALIYMHRYRDNTVARIRTDYLNTYQEKLENIVDYNLKAIEDTDIKAKDKKDLEKEIKALNGQIEELRKFAGPVKDLADKKIVIDLDDGVAVNYEKFKGILKKI